jgi:hypothetical protein
MSTTGDLNPERRQKPDRREVPTSVWGAFPPAGWRMRARRAEEHGRPYFVDRFAAPVLAAIVAVLALSTLDAVLTIHLVDAGSEEGNPLMGHLLNRGILPFLVGKYVLTAVGLPLLVIFKNHYLFATRFRVGYMIPAIVVLYALLIAYQVILIAGPCG